MKTTIQVIAVLVLSIIATNAQFFVTSWSGGNKVSVGPGSAGETLSVDSSPVTINALGVFATGPNGTLFDSHEVGIWNSDRILLADVLVTPANSLAVASAAGNTWFVNLSAPLTLAPGLYTLAAAYGDITFDQVIANASSVISAPGITIKDAVLSTGISFGFPDLVINGANGGFFGPNASFQTVVPEPIHTSIAVGFFLLCLAGIHRHYRKPNHETNLSVR